MERPDIETIKQNLANGAYGTMCKAATDRLATLIGYIEAQEANNSKTVERHIDGMVGLISEDVRRVGYYRNADLKEKARIAGRMVRGQAEEIRQLRDTSKMDKTILYAATDTVIEDIERKAKVLIEQLDEGEAAVLQDRFDSFMLSWRSFLGMTSERAAFQSAAQNVKEIRVKAIQLAVGLDKWRELDGVEVKSNTAGHDLDLIINVLAEVGGQASVGACHRYVKDYAGE